jgi:hypothetical protein
MKRPIGVRVVMNEGPRADDGMRRASARPAFLVPRGC